MRYYLNIVCAFFLIISVNQVSAEGGWWEDALAIFSSSESKTTAESVTSSKAISNLDLNAAFKEALQIGSENVVKQLAAVDGFNADSAIHIPLPAELQMVKKMLANVGMESLVDDLELKLNRAAENAAPQAKILFIDAIKAMTFEDIKAIYEGHEDAATQYFKGKMSLPLGDKMRPIIDQSLSEVGAVQAYELAVGKYSDLPFVPDVKANLAEHVVNKGIEGIFYYLAKEEAAIRKDPVKQTSTLLKQVFAQ